MKIASFAIVPAALLVSLASANAQTPASEQHNCTVVSQPFVGTICVPAGESGKHPAVILLGGSEGGDSFARLAPLFALRGYVAASVAYFGAPGLPATLVNIPVETIGKAIDALQARPDVNSSQLAIVGASKGGELSLLAASTYPQIKAVVADVPSPVAFMGLGQFNVPTGCSWSENGTPLPCVPADAAAGDAIGKEFAAHEPIVLTPMYDASLAANPAVTKAAFFPLQRIAGPVLCLSGADDKMWDSPAQCAMAMQYLKAHHHAYGDTSVAYPNAGHMFLFAMHGPSSAMTSFAAGPATMAFGGTAEGDAAAADAAWPVIWKFLSSALQTK